MAKFSTATAGKWQSRSLVRTALVLTCGMLITGATGVRCSIAPSFILPPLLPIRTVEVELVNMTDGIVDPGLFVDGVPILVSPLLAAREVVVLDVECFAGTTLQTDALLHRGLFTILSENAPLVRERTHFRCDDLVSFFFVEDAAGFFTDIAVNDVFLPIDRLAPIIRTVEVELVNATGHPVDAGFAVDGVPVVIDPPIAAGDIVVLDVDCFPRTSLETDAMMLTGFGPVLSENAPFLEEGFEFLCYDIVSFIFAEDALGFFTSVEVNGTLLP